MNLRRGIAVFGVLMGVGLGVAVCEGQGAAPPADDGTMTLHAYTNLVQMPVLVLGSSRERLRAVNPAEFRMSLDGGRPFRPVHVRLEGDDPLTLAILVDGNARRNELLAGVADGVAALVAGALQPQDRLMVYALDCERIRHMLSLPGDPQRLSHAISLLMLHVPGSAGAKADAKACKRPPHLWDAMWYVTRELSLLPGRRVLLAVTDGADGGSVVKWNGIKDFATQESVTIFAVSMPLPLGYSMGTSDFMQAVCEFSGGMRLWSHPKELSETLRRFVGMLRERYILDFSRPPLASAGVLGVQVTLGNRPVFIRPSGVSFPIADKAVLADPRTVPSDPARAPEIGSRRSLPQ